MAQVLALVDDLFFQAKILETAKHLGIAVRTSTTSDALLAEIAKETPKLVIVDLNARGTPLQAIARVRAAAAGSAADCISFARADGSGAAGAGGWLHAGDAAVAIHARPCNHTGAGKVLVLMMNRRFRSRLGGIGTIAAALLLLRRDDDDAASARAGIRRRGGPGCGFGRHAGGRLPRERNGICESPDHRKRRGISRAARDAAQRIDEAAFAFR